MAGARTAKLTRRALWRWSGWLALVLLVGLGCKPQAPAAPATPPPAPWQRPPVIDFHGHLSLDGAARIAQVLTENGIEKVINLSGGSARRGMAEWQQAKALADQFGGRIINFAMPNWRGFGQPGWAEREAEALQLAVDQFGFAGLKISKALGLGVTDATDQLIAPDDPRLAVPEEQAECTRLVRRIVEDLRAREPDPDKRMIEEPGDFESAAWIANRLCEFLPIAAPTKHKLMALDEPLTRLAIVHRWLQQHQVL